MGRRSGEAQAALGRRAPVMKHRLTPRGGSQPAIEPEEMDMYLSEGSLCEILPAYSHVTRDRSIFDEYTGCECQVLEVKDSGEVEVFIKGMGEIFIHIGRLKKLR